MALQKSQIVDPIVAKETVDVPEMGGEVVVQALTMTERLQLAALDLPKFKHVAETLARSVVDAAGIRIWTADQWDIFGGREQEAAWKLFKVSQKLSKLGGDDDEKKESTLS